MPRRRTYDPDLRRRAVEDVIDRGRPVAEVARELGIDSPERLQNWVRRTRLDRGLDLAPPPRRPRRRGPDDQAGGRGASGRPRPEAGRRAQMPRGFVSEKRTLPRR